MFLPQEELNEAHRSLKNLGESIESLLGSKDNLTFTWAESVRLIIENLFLSTDLPTSPCVVPSNQKISEQESDTLNAEISELEGELTTLRAAIREEDAKRRGMLNKYLDQKGNIRVFCRVRPLLFNEKRAQVGQLTISGCDTIQILVSGKRKRFELDRVFLPVSSQDDVFWEVEPVVRSALDGHNACIFAYGQTGTGKTFTMEGTAESPGVVPRTLQQLFHQACLDSAVSFHFTFSMLEVYMGCIRDLLVPPKRQIRDCPSKCLSIQMDSRGNVEVDNLTEFVIEDLHQANQLYQLGSLERTTSHTNANETSSRSHCLLRITISCTKTTYRSKDVSKLWLIDLGGSERLLKTHAKGQILEEGKAINLSLSALGDVISSLQRKQPHIPYRNSKLTQILQDCLGQESRTLMIVNVSPKEEDLRETVCSLSFAMRARGIHLGKSLSEKAEEERSRSMAETLQQMKFHEDRCQIMKGNMQELQFSITKKKEILELGFHRVKQSSVHLPNTMEKIFESKTRSEKEVDTTDWSANMPRFMLPTSCSRLKKRLDVFHSNDLGVHKQERKLHQGYRRQTFHECKAKDAKIVPVDWSPLAEQVVETDHRFNEVKVNKYHMQPKPADLPQFTASKLTGDLVMGKKNARANTKQKSKAGRLVHLTKLQP